MTMKRTELAKKKMIKITHAVRIAGVPDRFGAGSDLVDRKEQRRLDQAAGLIPFACKLPNELVKQLHARVAAEQSNMNDLVAGLLASALGNATTVPANVATPAAPEKTLPAAPPKTMAVPNAQKADKITAVAKKPAVKDTGEAKVAKVAKVVKNAATAKVAKLAKKSK